MACRSGSESTHSSLFANCVKSYFIVLWLLAYFSNASATSISEVTIPRLFEKSSVVVAGTIEAGRLMEDGCGVRYEVRVSDAFRGNELPGEVLSIQGDQPLTIGDRYFLFLSSVNEEFRAIGSSNGREDRLRLADIARCAKFRPNLVVNVFGSGAFKITATRNSAISEAVLIDDRIFVPTDGVTFEPLRRGDRSDTDRFEAAIRISDFSAMLKKLSSDEQK